jgi:hypothetical protein
MLEYKVIYTELIWFKVKELRFHNKPEMLNTEEY